MNKPLKIGVTTFGGGGIVMTTGGNIPFELSVSRLPEISLATDVAGGSTLGVALGDGSGVGAVTTGVLSGVGLGSGVGSTVGSGVGCGVSAGLAEGSTVLRSAGVGAGFSSGGGVGSGLGDGVAAADVAVSALSVAVTGVIGSGYESFGAAFTRYDTWSGQFRIEQAHNEYLQTLSDSGVIGFVLLAAFIFLLFRSGMKIIAAASGLRREIAIGALAACLGVMVHSFFDFPLRTCSNAFYFLMLCALATLPVGLEEAVKSRHNHRRRAH